MDKNKKEYIIHASSCTCFTVFLLHQRSIISIEQPAHRTYRAYVRTYELLQPTYTFYLFGKMTQRGDSRSKWSFVCRGLSPALHVAKSTTALTVLVVVVADSPFARCRCITVP